MVEIVVVVAAVVIAASAGKPFRLRYKDAPAESPGHFCEPCEVDPMALAILSLSRRHVLGNLYGRCNAVAGSIPVYLDGEEPELLGYADEGLGPYTDAFSFHLDTDSCKKLAMGQYSYSIDYAKSRIPAERGRLTLVSITLVRPKVYEKPVKEAV